MKNLQKTNVYRARHLNETFRYIDDITNVNANNKIGEIMKDIYGDVVKLNKENEGLQCAHVLDLSVAVNIELKTASTSLFDKRREFDFTISNFPDVTGNISNSMAYGIISSQLLRYYKACTIYSDFINNVNLLVIKLLQQSYDKDKIIKKIVSFVNKNPMCKYGLDKRTITSSIIEQLPSNITVAGRP